MIYKSIPISWMAKQVPAFPFNEKYINDSSFIWSAERQPLKCLKKLYKFSITAVTSYNEVGWKQHKVIIL